MRQCGPRKPWTADESPEAASNDTSAGEGPDFANSSRFHSAPFQRQPVNCSTGPALPFHSVTPSQIAEDRLPRHRERVSFRQVPSAGESRIWALPKLLPSPRPQHHSGQCLHASRLALRRVRADQMTDAVLERIGVAVLHARGGLEADDQFLVLAVFCRVVWVFEKLEATGKLEGRFGS
jgi:hypothetical protein